MTDFAETGLYSRYSLVKYVDVGCRCSPRSTIIQFVDLGGNLPAASDTASLSYDRGSAASCEPGSFPCFPSNPVPSFLEETQPLAADPRAGSCGASCHGPHQCALDRVALFLLETGKEVFPFRASMLWARSDWTLGNHPQLALSQPGFGVGPAVFRCHPSCCRSHPRV